MSICKGCDRHIKDNKGIENISSWYCSDCRKASAQALFVLFLIALFPGLLYLLINKNFFILDINVSFWIVASLWWLLLGIIYYYNNKIEEKNDTLRKLDSKFNLLNRLQSKQENNYKFEDYKLIYNIREARKSNNRK